MAQGLITESYLSDIASAIRSKNGQSISYTPSQMASAIQSIVSAGELTIISKSINANGVYTPSSDNADAFSGVVVNVPNTYNISDEGKVVASGSLSTQGSLSIYSNSVYDTTLYSQVNVSVEGLQPIFVSKIITENGSYDPTDDNADAYSQVVVNVSGGGGTSLKDFIEMNYSEINDESVSLVGSYAFCFALNLERAYFGNVSIISDGAFSYCINLKTISAPNLENIGRAFISCSKLQEISFPKCESVSLYAFDGCSRLSNVSLPECTYVGEAAFRNNYLLRDVYIPKATYIGQTAFQNCSSISKIVLPNIQSISRSAFVNCGGLSEIYILTSSLCNLTSSNAFQNTPIQYSSYLGYFGSIYVPSSLVEAYKSAVKWSVYSDRITAYIEE